METPHKFSRDASTAPVTASAAYRLSCPECGWTHIIATPDAPPVVQCPWCGWEDIQPEQAGAFASLVCAVHGRVTCVITDPNIGTDDFMDLFCPHCRLWPEQER